MTGLRERNKSKRRDAILDATLALLRERDFADVTVEEIAADAEVSPHTVYNLVGTRDDLIVALLGRVTASMAQTAPTFGTRTSDPSDPSEPLRAVLDHAVDALLTEPVAYRRVVRVGAALTVWPVSSRQPPRLVADAVAVLAEHGALAGGVTARGVARHVYAGFVGWLMTWANGLAGDRQLRDRVGMNVSLVLAATTTGDVQARAASHIRKDLG